jgi:type VI secretion system (T6SS) phospholipase Tle1-like effector
MAQSATSSPRNLVLCCDGTGNIWGNGHDTNVVKLVRLLQKDDQQCVYYDPGVGTTDNFPPVGLWNRFKENVRRLVGLTLADGLYDSIGRGYQFLIDNFREGDRISVFGFSRGAFTARSIAGIVNEFGIVQSGAKTLVALIVRTYFMKPHQRAARPDKSRQGVAADIRQNFCSPAGSEAHIHFLGVWDTVASVGLLGLKIKTDANVRIKNYQHVRHAVALHETRWKYSPRLYTDSGAPKRQGQTYKQVWFNGCHSDVGGSYAEAELSNLSLRWMIDEASAPGVDLRFSSEAGNVIGNPNGLLHDEPFQSPWWTLVGLANRFRPVGAIDHPSVGQRAAEGLTVWKPLWRLPRFWILAMATLGLSLLPALVLSWSEADFAGKFAHVMQYQANPARYLQPPKEFSDAAVRLATWLDCLLIPVYLSLFSLLVVTARRGLRYGPQNTRAATIDLCTSALLLILLAVADIAENIGVFAGVDFLDGRAIAWIQTWTAVKVGLLGLLALYLLIAGLLSLRRTASSPRPQQIGPSDGPTLLGQ